ncbi:hypothetical protein [Rhizobium rhizogenes]|uniref:hypothetical protein n=1 Tax=Rhizobium rhizogenes TaxID=359 RepID=UPI001572228B|nr:hypothetical protein [Rhizobium rhizogenes]NTF69399.1 hypothetical protein [Rhizobium rhizogenes]
MTDFDPTAIATLTVGHNLPPVSEFDLVKTEIEDLFMEAINWCDGEAIQDQATHDAIERLYDGLHAAGAKADALRVKEKEPFDVKIAEIQARFAPLIADNKSVKGKVTLGKQELSKLLTPWRTKVAADKKAEADRVAAAAVEAKRLADLAIQQSSGNLAAREEAEEQLAEAKRLEKTANRTFKAATTGTGLRTVWVATPAVEKNSEELRLEWAYNKDPTRFAALVQQMADEAVRGGSREIPGFIVAEDKRAA